MLLIEEFIRTVKSSSIITNLRITLGGGGSNFFEVHPETEVVTMTPF